ncbi:MAG: NAD(P)-dependent oxidoreductase [Gemmatimonadetes bacterium]|nr:NAD(P)-dependent oxidoreductase [Gemmatimonadota bacterium]
MKILVTGSHGRVGGNLVKRLLAKGHDIRGFVYPGDASRAGKWKGIDEVEVVEGDLRDYEAVSRAVEGVDAVYHLAAAFASPHSHIEYLQINGLGTLHLLEAVREKVPNLQRFVYACTEAIYWKVDEAGRLFEQPISEDMVSATKAMPYFLTKWIGEELVMNYHVQYGVPSVVCRFATIFEPSEFLTEDGVPKFCTLRPPLERLRRQKNPTDEQRAQLASMEKAWGGGARVLVSRCPDGRSFKQEWADVRDIALGLSLSLDRDEAVGEAFTLGGMLIVWEDDVPKVADYLGVGYTEAIMPAPNFFEFDRTKTQNLLGYRAEHDLWSTLNTALAMQEGKDTDVVPTGVRYGRNPA